MSNISSGIGATLTIGATNIGGLTKLSTPQMKRTAIDVTTLSSPNGFKQIMAGLADAGTFGVEGLFDTADAGQMTLNANFIASEMALCTITFPSIVGASWSATCMISDLQMGGDLDVTKAATFKCTLTINGEPSFATVPAPALTGLTASGTSGTFSPSFSGSTMSYGYDFITSTSIAFTPTASESLQCTLYVDGVIQGAAFTVGTASPAIAFSTAGSHLVSLVISGAGYSSQTYTITAVRTT